MPSMRFLAVLILASLLGACKTLMPNQPQTAPSDNAWQRDGDFFVTRYRQVSTLDNWSLNAKLGVVAPQLRESARLVWRHAEQAHQLRLLAPLGVASVVLEYDRFGALLIDHQGRKHSGASAPGVLQEVTGLLIPVSALHYWLFALPEPQIDYAYQRNQAGQLEYLRQAGWQVHYQNYRAVEGIGKRIEKTTGLNLVMPHKIIATQLLPNGEHKVTLIIKGWR